MEYMFYLSCSSDAPFHLFPAELLTLMLHVQKQKNGTISEPWSEPNLDSRTCFALWRLKFECQWFTHDIIAWTVHKELWVACDINKCLNVHDWMLCEAAFVYKWFFATVYWLPLFVLRLTWIQKLQEFLASQLVWTVTTYINSSKLLYFFYFEGPVL